MEIVISKKNTAD